MGSYALSTSNTSATDKRQVTSENATGQSVDGNSNLTNAGMYQALSNSSINSLDGGAIKGAFDFANKSLSSIIALAVERDKAAAYTTAPSGLAGFADVGASAQNASAPASVEAVDKAKKIGLVVVVGSIVAVWWLWGRK